MIQSPLKFLHDENALIELKLEHFRKLSTEELIASLKPEMIGALKVKADGTIMDRHHRIKILQERGIDIDNIPREIWKRIK